MFQSDLVETMPADEFSAWQIVERIQPFGEMGQYIRNASLMALLANINRDPESGKVYSYEDFMPTIGADGERRTSRKFVAETEEQIKAFMMAMGAVPANG